MFKLFFLALTTSFVAPAYAGQIKPEDDLSPRCYTGNIKTALEELLLADFDPIFSAEHSFIEGNVIVGVQIDENGEELVTRLPRCK